MLVLRRQAAWTVEETIVDDGDEPSLDFNRCDAARTATAYRARDRVMLGQGVWVASLYDLTVAQCAYR
jgi:hypothetical protein